MPFGWDDALMAIPAGINLFQQLSGQGKQNDQFQLAVKNYEMQRRAMDQQRELQTAGRSDARGNSTVYIPGQGWKSYFGPEVATQQSLQDDLMKKEMLRQQVSGEHERNRDSRRRLEESDAASPLLRQFAGGYGMPTRAGVKGKASIAGVTESSEGTDLRKNAASAAALRQGSGSSLGNNLSKMDRAGTAGIRTALAKSDLQGDQMFDAMYKAAAGNKLDPYNMLAGRASGQPQFKPTDIGGDAASQLGQAATGAVMRPASGAGVQDAFKTMAAANQANINSSPSWDTFALGIANTLKNGMKPSPTPWSESAGNPAAFNSWRF